MNLRDLIDICERVGDPMVYHSTDFGPEIMHSGMIKANSTVDVDTIASKATDTRFDTDHHETHGVCVTRSFYFARQFSNVIFGIDLARVRQNFKIVKRAETGAYDLADDHGDYRIEAEEFIICPGLDLGRFVTHIWLNQDFHGDDEYRDIVSDARFSGYFRTP